MRTYYSFSHSEEATTVCSDRLEEAISPEQQFTMEHEHFSLDGSTDTGNKGTNCSRKEEDDKPLYFNNKLDWRKLLRSLTSITSSKSVVESRLVTFVVVKLHV